MLFNLALCSGVNVRSCGNLASCNQYLNYANFINQILDFILEDIISSGIKHLALLFKKLQYFLSFMSSLIIQLILCLCFFFFLSRFSLLSLPLLLYLDNNFLKERKKRREGEGRRPRGNYKEMGMEGTSCCLFRREGKWNKRRWNFLLTKNLSWWLR